MFTDFSGDFYKPLVHLSYALERALFGPSPAVPHAGNIFLHAANSVLAFFVAERWAGSRKAAVFAAAIFAVHPAHVESVAWVSQRKDVLYAFFWLLSILAYDRWRNTREKRAYAASWLLFVLSLMAKPAGAALPLVLIAADILAYRRKTYVRLLLEKTPFFAAAAAAGFLTIGLQKTLGAFGTPAPFPGNLLHVSDAILLYARQSVWPAKLYCAYPFPDAPGTFFWSRPWLSAAAAFSLLGAGAALAVRHPRAAMPLVFFVLTLLPNLPWMPVGTAIAADRYLYVPVLGPAMAAGLLFSRFRASALAGAAVIVVFSVLSWMQCGVWKDDGTLWTHELSAYPENPLAQANLGIYLAQNGQAKEGAHRLKKVVLRLPANTKARAGLALTLKNAGRLDDAAFQYRYTAWLDPRHAQAQYELGWIAIERGDLKDAFRRTEEALRYTTLRVPVLLQRARIRLLQRDFEAALLDIDEALRLDPENPAALQMRAHVEKVGSG